MSACRAQAARVRQRSPRERRRRMRFPQRSFVMRWMVSSAVIGSDPAVFPDPGSDLDAAYQREQQLLALVGGVEVRHADLVAGGLRAVVGLAVDGLEIAEDAIAGAWHGQKI